MVLKSLVALERSSESLPDCLPWLDYVTDSGKDYALCRNSNILAGAEISGCEGHLASDEALNSISNDIHALIQNLPAGYALTVTYLRRKAAATTLRPDETAPPILHFLADQQAAFWNQRRPLMRDHRAFLFLEAETGGLRDTAGRAFRAAFGLAKPFDYPALKQSLTRFSARWNTFLAGLSAFSSVHALTAAALHSLFQYMLNPTADVLKYNPAYTIAEQAASASFNDKGADLVLETNGTAGPNLSLRVLSLGVLPPTSYPGIFSTFAQLPTLEGQAASDYWITQHFEPVPSESFITTLNLKRNWGESLATMKALRSVAQKSVDLAEEAAEVTQAIQRDKETVGRFSQYAVVVDRDTNRLTKTVQALQAEASSLNARLIIETRFARFASFLSSLPGNSGLNVRRILNYRQNAILAANFADFALVHKESTGDADGPICFDTPESTLFRIDPFTKRATSWNAYISGTTGAGKSFLMNHLLANSVSSIRPIVYILDIGGSYAPLIDIVPGSVRVDVDFSNPDLELNPFQFAVRPAQTDLVTLSHLIEHLITGGAGALNQRQRVDVLDALAALYEGYDPSNPPTIDDYYKCLFKLSPPLAKPIRLWMTGGPYAAFFAHKHDRFQSADLVYFELTGFDDHPDVAAALIFILFSKLFQRLQSPADAGRRKMIVLDECWKFLLNDTMANKIKELYRTIRKHGGAIYTITQSPMDLINSPHRDAIVSNTSFFYFLQQKGLPDDARDLFKLNPRQWRVLNDVQMRRNLGYSEALLIGPYQRRLRIRADRVSYYLYTTDAGEKVQRAELTEELGSLQAAVEVMAKAETIGMDKALLQAKRLHKMKGGEYVA